MYHTLTTSTSVVVSADALSRDEPWKMSLELVVAVDTSGRIYDDFSRLLFLHAHREESVLTNELPEESDQFRFLRAASLANLKGSLGLNSAKASAFRIWRKLHEDFYTASFVISAFYTINVLYSFQTLYTTFRSFPCFSSSVFCLSGTWRVSI